MIKNCLNINKTNSHLSSQIIEQKSTIIYDKNFKQRLSKIPPIEQK
jgi:hypothetical protein